MKILTLSIAILCGGLVACGGDDDGSGVDSDKPFSEATVEDAMAFCEYVEGLNDPEVTQRIECYIDAIFAAEQGEGECQAIAEQCLAEPLEEEEPSECAEIDGSDLEELPACASEVTFGEYEECVEALFSRNAAIADEISCDTDLEPLFEENGELPEPCLQARAACPELFSDDDA
jgi:hypothetical protein